jgi:hypothetical protein
MNRVLKWLLYTFVAFAAYAEFVHGGEYALIAAKAAAGMSLGLSGTNQLVTLCLARVVSVGVTRACPVSMSVAGGPA